MSVCFRGAVEPGDEGCVPSVPCDHTYITERRRPVVAMCAGQQFADGLNKLALERVACRDLVPDAGWGVLASINTGG